MRNAVRQICNMSNRYHSFLTNDIKICRNVYQPRPLKMDENTPITDEQKAQKKIAKKEFIEILVNHKKQKYHDSDEEHYREKWQACSAVNLATKVAKIKLHPKDFRIVDAYVDYIYMDNLENDRSNSMAYLLYETSIDDARKFLNDEKICVIEELGLFGEKYSDGKLVELKDKLKWCRRRFIMDMEVTYNIPEDELKPLSSRELLDKKSLLEKQKMEEEFLKEQKKLEASRMEKLSKLERFYGVTTQVTSPDDVVSEAEKIQTQREQEQLHLKTALIERIIKRPNVFKGVFGDSYLDCEIDEIFTLKQLYELFLNSTVRTPKVSSIMNGNPRDTKYIDYNSTGILFNALFHNRGRFGCYTSLEMCVSKSDVPLLRSKAYEFVLKEMIDDGRVKLIESSNKKYVRMMNELELYILCSGSDGDENPLRVHDSHPSIMTENVVKFVDFMSRYLHSQSKVVKTAMNRAVDDNCSVM